MQYTVLGAEGFIGSHVLKRLQARHISYRAYTHDTLDHLEESLGHVLYCIGLTADFRQRPFDTADAHVHVLSQVLRQGHFESLTYLSSTRVYQGSSRTEETTPLILDVFDAGDLFNASKLLGECLCLWGGRRNVRIVRVSNVVGPRSDNNVFLDQVLHEAFSTGEIVFHTTPDSSKDFIHIDDVVSGLLPVSERGGQPIYNLAAGYNISNRWIGELLSSQFGVRVRYSPEAREWSFPAIDISRLKNEFGFEPMRFQDYIADYIVDFRKRNHL